MHSDMYVAMHVCVLTGFMQQKYPFLALRRTITATITMIITATATNVTEREKDKSCVCVIEVSHQIK